MEFWGHLKLKIKQGTPRFFSNSAFPFGVLAILLLAVLFWQNHQLFQKIDRLEKHVSRLIAEKHTSNLSRSEAGHLIIRKPSPGTTLFSNKITVSGMADDGSIILLEQGGKLMAVTLADQGTFTFKRVPLSRKNSRLRVKEITSRGRVRAVEDLDLHFAPPDLLFRSRPIRKGNPHQKKIALTFDGGSSNNITDRILDILHEKEVHCTLFLTGEFIQRFPETVRRMVREGHEIGNHTFHHPHLTTYVRNRRHETLPGLTKERFQNELKQTAEIFKAVTGRKMAPFWRAPYGESNSEIRRWAAELGYREVDWTIGRDQKENMDTRDWVAQPGDPGYQSGEAIKQKILKFASEPGGRANGAIVLMHLASYRKQDFPYEKLPEIIDSLRAKGYELVPVRNLLK